MKKKIANSKTITTNVKNAKKNDCNTVKLNLEIDLTKCDSNFLTSISPWITDSETLHNFAKYIISHPNTKDFYDTKINIIENPNITEDTLIYFAENEQDEFVRAHLLKMKHTIYLANLLAEDTSWYVIKKLLLESTFIGLSKFEHIIDRLVNNEISLPTQKSEFQEFLTTIFDYEHMKSDEYVHEKISNKILKWVKN